MFSKSSIGQLGEKEAAKFLARKGYRILQFNFRSRFGEIDIVARDKNQLVFVEVKTRSETQFGSPAEAISYFKLAKMIKTAQYYLIRHPQYSDYRFDAVEVFIAPQISINHIKNITQ